MSAPRPKFNPEIAKRAARVTVQRLLEDQLIEASGLEQGIADLARLSHPHMDGYELAQRLDRYAGWGCDFPMAEALNSHSYVIRAEIEAAEKAWAEEWLIAPPLEIRSRVKIPGGELGVISEVYAHGPAKFLILVDGEKSDARRVVNFEDVTAVDEVSS